MKKIINIKAMTDDKGKSNLNDNKNPKMKFINEIIIEIKRSL